jgi:hypothetical protein
MQRIAIGARLVFVAALFISLAVPSNSQTLRMGGYMHPKNAEERFLFSMYVAGVRDGLEFYAAVEQKQNPAAKRLFCLPKNIALVTEQAEEIIRRWAEQHSDSIADRDSVALTLLLGLEQNFPCGSQ